MFSARISTWAEDIRVVRGGRHRCVSQPSDILPSVCRRYANDRAPHTLRSKSHCDGHTELCLRCTQLVQFKEVAVELVKNRNYVVYVDLCHPDQISPYQLQSLLPAQAVACSMRSDLCLLVSQSV